MAYLIEPGDLVMADKGFDLISYELFIRGCKLNIPPFVRGGCLSKTEVTNTRKIASLRIHVERAIGCVKQLPYTYIGERGSSRLTRM